MSVALRLTFAEYEHMIEDGAFNAYTTAALSSSTESYAKCHHLDRTIAKPFRG